MSRALAGYLQIQTGTGILNKFIIPRKTPVQTMQRAMTDLTLISDEIIAGQMQQGKMHLIEELIKRHSARLLRLIRGMLPSGASACESPEDILQETWILAIRKIHLFDASRSFKPWITQVAINCCRDRLRHNKFRLFWTQMWSGRDASSEFVDPGAENTADAQLEVEKSLKKISPKLREVVVLKFFGGLSMEEISNVLKIPVGTVKSRLNYALENLRNLLELKETVQ